jgi:hypothetical protein
MTLKFQKLANRGQEICSQTVKKLRFSSIKKLLEEVTLLRVGRRATVFGKKKTLSLKLSVFE